MADTSWGILAQPGNLFGQSGFRAAIAAEPCRVYYRESVRAFGGFERTTDRRIKNVSFKA